MQSCSRQNEAQCDATTFSPLRRLTHLLRIYPRFYSSTKKVNRTSTSQYCEETHYSFNAVAEPMEFLWFKFFQIDILELFTNLFCFFIKCFGLFLYFGILFLFVYILFTFST